MEINILAIQDLESYASFLQTSWLEISSMYSKEAQEAESKNYTLDNIKNLFNDANNLLMVVKENGKIIAARYAYFEANTLFLHFTAVDSQHRRKGIGSKLHQFTFDYLKKNYPNVHKVWCDTLKKNKRGQLILKKLGYKKEASLKNHWYRDDYYLWGYWID